MLKINRSRDRKGEVHVGQTFIGRYRPKRDEQGEHALNFQRALENALQIADSDEVVAARKRMGLRNQLDVRVTFEAAMTIESPGNIGEYRVTVTEL